MHEDTPKDCAATVKESLTPQGQTASVPAVTDAMHRAAMVYLADQRVAVTSQHVNGALHAALEAAPQPAQAKSRQQEIINSIKSALIRHEAATDAVVATAAGDDPHAATLAGIELEKAAALLATWTQPEYLRVMLAAAPQAPQPAQAAPAPEPEVWLYDFMDGATTVRNWSTTNKAEAYAPGNFNQRGYVPAEN